MPKGDIVESVVSYIVKAIVDDPDAVEVTVMEEDRRGDRRSAGCQVRHGSRYRTPRTGRQSDSYHRPGGGGRRRLDDRRGIPRLNQPPGS